MIGEQQRSFVLVYWYRSPVKCCHWLLAGNDVVWIFKGGGIVLNRHHFQVDCDLLDNAMKDQCCHDNLLFFWTSPHWILPGSQLRLGFVWFLQSKLILRMAWFYLNPIQYLVHLDFFQCSVSFFWSINTWQTFPWSRDPNRIFSTFLCRSIQFWNGSQCVPRWKHVECTGTAR